MKILKQKNGMAIIVVLTYFLTLVIILGALFAMTISNFNNQNTSIDHSESYYAAESCLNIAVEDFKDVIDVQLANTSSIDAFYSAMDALSNSINGTNITNDTSDAFSHPFSSVECSLAVNILGENGTGRDYQLVATGSSDGVERTVSKMISLNYGTGSGNGFTSDYAILTKSSIDIKKSIINSTQSGVNANIASYSQKKESIELEKATIDGFVYLLPGTNSSVVQNDNSSILGIEKMLDDIPFPEISFTSIDTQAATVLSEDNRLSKLSANGGKFKIEDNGSILSNKNAEYTYILNPSSGSYGGYYAPTIDLQGDVEINVNSDTFIVTDQLAFGKNSTIKFTGSGILTIYVRERLNYSKNHTVNFKENSEIGRLDSPEKLLIYVKQYYLKGDIPTLEFSNNSTFYGSLMLENIDISVNNNSALLGFIATNGENVTLSNNSDTTTPGLIFAPNAEVEFSNNSVFYGSVISDSVKMKENVVFNYVPMIASDFPFELIDPITGQPYGGGSGLDFTFGSNQEIN